MKPGWKTTEFWISAATQVVAVLALLGVADTAQLQDAIVKGISGLAAAIVSGVYIWGRVKAKSHGIPSEPPYAAVLVGIMACMFAGGPAQAQQPVLWLPWRDGIEKRMQAYEREIADLRSQLGRGQGLGPIAQGPIVEKHYYHGSPKQEFPAPGVPKQEFPAPGSPKQEFPAPGVPKQEFQPPGPPKQEFQPPGKPKQELMPPADPKPPTGLQRFTNRPPEIVPSWTAGRPPTITATVTPWHPSRGSK
jgi:hypothetical protein